MTSNVTTVSFAQGTASIGDTAVFEIFIKATPGQIWVPSPIPSGAPTSASA